MVLLLLLVAELEKAAKSVYFHVQYIQSRTHLEQGQTNSGKFCKSMFASKSFLVVNHSARLALITSCKDFFIFFSVIEQFKDLISLSWEIESYSYLSKKTYWSSWAS